MAGDGASLHMDKLGPHAGMQVVRKERGVWRVGRGWPSELRAFEHVIVRKLKLQKHYTRVGDTILACGHECYSTATISQSWCFCWACFLDLLFILNTRSNTEA